MTHYYARPMSKAKRNAQRRSFALYRLSGMMGNLGRISFEYRHFDDINLQAFKAMDKVYELIQLIKEEK